MFVFYFVLLEVWAWESNHKLDKKTWFEKKKKQAGECCLGWVPWGLLSLWETLLFAIQILPAFLTQGDPSTSPLLWGRTWTGVAVSLYSEILTICNFQGWRDDMPPTWLGNMEKQRACGWSTIQGEVTSAKIPSYYRLLLSLLGSTTVRHAHNTNDISSK